VNAYQVSRLERNIRTSRAHMVSLAISGWKGPPTAGRVVSICAALVLAACGSSDTNSWVAYEPTYAFEGKTLEQWAVEWARWEYANTTCDEPDVDEDGSKCGLYQPTGGPVFFLAGGTALTTRKKCVVPKNKALLLPLSAYMTDNTGVPQGSKWSTMELKAHAADAKSSMTDMHLVSDGVEASGLERYGIGPTQYTYDVPPEPNWFSCNGQPGVTGTIDPAVVAGYFVLMPAPNPGMHELEYAGVSFTYPDNTWTGDKQTFSDHVKTTFVVDN
jgi:hypothetical protein